MVLCYFTCFHLDACVSAGTLVTNQLSSAMLIRDGEASEPVAIQCAFGCFQNLCFGCKSALCEDSGESANKHECVDDIDKLILITEQGKRNKEKRGRAVQPQNSITRGVLLFNTRFAAARPMMTPNTTTTYTKRQNTSN